MLAIREDESSMYKNCCNHFMCVYLFRFNHLAAQTRPAAAVAPATLDRWYLKQRKLYDGSESTVDRCV